jgi:hypothetical protein
MDDRQPAEMRVQLRSNIQTQFKSSFAGIINIPVPIPAYSHGTGQSLTNSSSTARVQPAQLVSGNLYTPTPIASSVLSSVPTPSAPYSSSSSSPAGIITLPQRDNDSSFQLNEHRDNVGSLFNPQEADSPVASNSNVKTATTRIAATQQHPIGGMGGVSLGMGGISAEGEGGGMNMDIEALRAMQVKSMKIATEALRASERERELLAGLIPSSSSEAGLSAVGTEVREGEGEENLGEEDEGEEDEGEEDEEEEKEGEDSVGEEEEGEENMKGGDEEEHVGEEDEEEEGEEEENEMKVSAVEDSGIDKNDGLEMDR